METYDVVMIVVLVGATLFGAIKGFAWQLASIASIVVSYLVAYHFREPFSESIKADPPWNRFLAMLILYVGTSLVIWVLFRMVSNSIDRMRLREFDRQIGAIFGLAKGGLYCVLITLFAVTLLGNTVREKIVASKSGRYIAQVLNKSESVIPPEIQEVVEPYLAKFDQKFNSASSTTDPWSIPERATEGTLPSGFWETAGSVAEGVRSMQENGSPSSPWSTPASTPSSTTPTSPWSVPGQTPTYPQQATTPAAPWMPYQR